MKFRNAKLLAFTLILSTLFIFVTVITSDLGSQETSVGTSQTKPNQINSFEVITQFHRTLYESISDAVVVINSKATKINNNYGSGTGFIIDADGYILTLIENVDSKDESVEIMFRNGKKSKANFVGNDALNGCALLKLSEPFENLKYLKFGDSKNLGLGDSVFVLSNSFNDFTKTFNPIMSKGEITGFYRPSKQSFEKIKWQRRFDSSYRGAVIEISCSVNDASFGAPVINLSGEFVGIVSRTVDINRWLGTAIPAHQILANLENMKLNKSNVGAKINFAIEDIAEGSNKGLVRITEIFENASYNNLKKDDIIKIIDCDELTQGKEELDEIIKILPANSKVYWTIIRDDKIIRTLEFLE